MNSESRTTPISMADQVHSSTTCTHWMRTKPATRTTQGDRDEELPGADAPVDEVADVGLHRAGVAGGQLALVAGLQRRRAS